MSQSDGADHQAELDWRLQKYIDGDLHALDGFDEPEEQQMPTVLNAGERQVRDLMGRQRPTLDSATQKLWDDWFIRKFNEAIKPLAEGIGERVESLHNELAENIDAIEKENDKSVKAHNQLVQGVERIHDSVGKIRGSARADMIEAIRRLDRNFLTEVAELRAKVISKCNEDMTSIKNDVVAIVRASVMDDLVAIKAAAIDEMRKDMNTAVAEKFQKLRGAVKRFVGWLSNKDRQFLVDEVRATVKDELLGEIRSELTDVLATMREEVVKEVRSEIEKGIETPQGSFKE